MARFSASDRGESLYVVVTWSVDTRRGGSDTGDEGGSIIPPRTIGRHNRMGCDDNDKTNTELASVNIVT